MSFISVSKKTMQISVCSFVLAHYRQCEKCISPQPSKWPAHSTLAGQVLKVVFNAKCQLSMDLRFGHKKGPSHRVLEDTGVLNPVLQASQWVLDVAKGKMPGLGCGPLQCQALSVSACCCSQGFHPLHNPSRPLLQSPQAHQRLIFHASRPAGEAHSQGQVGGMGGRGGLRRPVSQHLSLGRVLGPGQ